jgi:hypothetical protein
MYLNKNMIGKVVEIYFEFTTISLYNSDIKIRIGDWLEFPSHSVLGSVISIEKDSIQVEVVGSLEKIKLGDEVSFYDTINEVNVELFGNVWGGFDANLELLDRDFNTKNLELSGLPKYDFIPVVRVNETVHKKQKIGYIELQKKLKYWILTPDNCQEYVVKKINSGTFLPDEKIVILENEDKKYDVKILQQFNFEAKLEPITLGPKSGDGELSIGVENLETKIEESTYNQSQESAFDFTVHVSTFLSNDYNSKKLNYITFLTSQNDIYELVLQKSYNLSLYLAYCGYKVLLKVDLGFEIGELNSCKTINFEGEEGLLFVEK